MFKIDTTLFDINYENLKLSTKKINGKTIYIIDDFYKYPQKILDFYNKQELVKEYTTYFPGDRYHIYFQKKHLEEIKKLIKAKCKHYNFIKNSYLPTDRMCFSKFVPDYMKEKDKFRYRCNPHCDTMRNDNMIPVIVLGYLCKVNHGGTGFYKNKELNTNLAKELFKCQDYTKIYPYNHFRLNNKSCDKFELLDLVNLKWNRVVIYEGDCLHSIYVEDYEIYRKNDRVTTTYWFYANED
jgi:hypothetical protein